MGLKEELKKAHTEKKTINKSSASNEERKPLNLGSGRIGNFTKDEKDSTIKE